jgi:hypothetical protein
MTVKENVKIGGYCIPGAIVYHLSKKEQVIFKRLSIIDESA